MFGRESNSPLQAIVGLPQVEVLKGQEFFIMLTIAMLRELYRIRGNYQTYYRRAQPPTSKNPY